MAHSAPFETRRQRLSGFVFTLTKNVCVHYSLQTKIKLTLPGYDIYRPEINDELQRFYDRYCKDVDNGWEIDTPPLRLSLLGFERDGSASKTVIERPEDQWPLARQRLRNLHLDAASMMLSSEPVASVSSTSYESHSLDASAVSLSTHQM